MSDHVPSDQPSLRERLEPVAFFALVLAAVATAIALVTCEAMGCFPNAL